MAPDQRYCLTCGNRRGDPRLPFMDAVVFMDAVKQPRGAGAVPPASPPPAKRFSPSATLVAGVATLVLAIGVGVLIGRSGEDSGSGNVAATPQVIKVENGGGGTAESTAETGTKAKENGKSGKAKSSKKKGGKEEVETGASGTSKAAEEILKPTSGVKLPPPTTQLGGSCEKGTAGCSKSGEFNGEFFGE